MVPDAGELTVTSILSVSIVATSSSWLTKSPTSIYGYDITRILEFLANKYIVA